LIGAALAIAAHSASAQNPVANAKRLTQNAVAATNAHTEAEQRPDGQAPVSPKMASTNSTAAAVTQKPIAAGQQVPVPESDTAGPPPSILREAYVYARDGRRDPFNSLLNTAALRPALSDLKLVGVLVDHTGGRSVATLHDLGTNAQYRVTLGTTLGRMRVAAIKLSAVVFTIDEFGTTRQDSLVLRDTTKVRP
jgi:hypothetical protein